ncbi:MAG: hypothetical protein ACR2PH_06360, partial [Desulfobulbia bacterium]
ITIYEPLVPAEVENYGDGNMAIGLLWYSYLPFVSKRDNYVELDNDSIVTYVRVDPVVARFYMLSKEFSREMDRDFLIKMENANMKMVKILSDDALVDSHNVHQGTKSVN